MKTLKSIFTSIKKFWALIRNNPGMSALILTALVVIPLAVIMDINLPDKSTFNLVFALIVIIFGAGSLVWFMIASLLEKNA